MVVKLPVYFPSFFSSSIAHIIHGRCVELMTARLLCAVHCRARGGKGDPQSDLNRICNCLREHATPVSGNGASATVR